MKILLTGASGYLGGRLCNALLRQGYSVRVLVRSTSDLSALPPPSSAAALEIVYGDVTDYVSLLPACSGCSVVFHLAALVEPWLPDPSNFFSVNVGGLKNVLEAVKETKTVEKLIYTSSFFALGPTDDGGVADENQVHHEKFFCTEYEKSKVIADKIAVQAASEGVSIVLLYPGVIYGPGKVTAGNIVARMIIERFNGRLPGYIGYGNDKFSFSHVDDVVDGQISAMRKGQPGNRYLLTGENASFKQVFDMAAMMTDTKRPILSIPLWVIEAYGWLSVLFSRITGKLPLISPPGLPVHFCKANLPKQDEVINLIDEDGNEYPTIYLPRKTGLSGGWKGFAVAHDLADGDALVFQLIKRTAFKVYIVRANSSAEEGKQHK